MSIKHPFQNESETFQLGDLTIENRLDRLSLSGDIDITLDKKGLANALVLTELLNRVVSEMQKLDLPDAIAIEPPVKVTNPFA
ncbi:MAG: hypothetical protein HOP04_02035 [Methylophilaceae bacterium]|nr:hypothetical protein [Methylophilaceae bacterium]